MALRKDILNYFIIYKFLLPILLPIFSWRTHFSKNYILLIIYKKLRILREILCAKMIYLQELLRE